jgi:hypothetical protein
MTENASARARWDGTGVRCPICLDKIPYDLGRVYRRVRGSEYEIIELAGVDDDTQLAYLLRAAYLRCPNRYGLETHYLPVAYVRHGEKIPPLVVGLVGDSLAGKTHLLAAMISELVANKLNSYQIGWHPLDLGIHQEYQSEYVERLIVRRLQLVGTLPDPQPHFVNGFLLNDTNDADRPKRPIAFFDVPGESLRSFDGNRFLEAVDALIFVADAMMISGFDPTGTRDPTFSGPMEDPTFTAVLGRLHDRPPHSAVAGAVVVAKSDFVRFEYPVDTWLREPPMQTLDPDAFYRESRDAYAFLHSRRAHAWLRPVEVCGKCTLHFVSATGGRPDGERFPREVRPLRVLNPLVAILAMTGVLRGPDAARVGA